MFLKISNHCQLHYPEILSISGKDMLLICHSSGTSTKLNSNARQTCLQLLKQMFHELQLISSAVYPLTLSGHSIGAQVY